MLPLQVLLSSSIRAGLTLLSMLVVEMGSSGTSGDGDSSRLSGTGTAPVQNPGQIIGDSRNGNIVTQSLKRALALPRGLLPAGYA